MQAVLLNSDERTELPSISANEDSSGSKQPICDQQNTDCSTRSCTDDPMTNVSVCPDSNFSNGSQGSLSENISFMDDCEIEKLDFIETRLFLNRNQCEPQRKLSENPCGRLGRLSRASFMVESSLQRIADSERSDQPPEQSCAKKAFRRQSKFKSIGRTREYGAPRMSAKDRKLLQMILVIFVSFLVCYLPITVTKLFQSTLDWRGLNIAGYILIYLTTCINPIIYVVMSSEYRSAYKYVLLCKGWTGGASKRRLPDRLTSS